MSNDRESANSEQEIENLKAMNRSLANGGVIVHEMLEESERARESERAAYTSLIRTIEGICERAAGQPADHGPFFLAEIRSEIVTFNRQVNLPPGDSDVAPGEVAG